MTAGTLAPGTLAVLGAGSWGTALASLAARNGLATTLWGRDAAVIEAIDRQHHNPRYLPGIELPASLRATTDLADAVRGSRWILVVVRWQACTETLHALKALQ
ncbi:MAG: glycerol-3-phosphate dehydrogenase, partial [Ottowia sp.]